MDFRTTFVGCCLAGTAISLYPEEGCHNAPCLQNPKHLIILSSLRFVFIHETQTSLYFRLQRDDHKVLLSFPITKQRKQETEVHA